MDTAGEVSNSLGSPIETERGFYDAMLAHFMSNQHWLGSSIETIPSRDETLGNLLCLYSRQIYRVGMDGLQLGRGSQ